MAPSWSKFSIAILTKTDWSNTTLATSFLGTSTNYSNRVSVTALLQDRQIHRALTIHAHDVGLNLLCVYGASHVLHQHGRLPDRLKRHLVNVGCFWNLAVGVKVVVDGPDFHIAGRQNQVAIVDGTDDIHHRKLVRLQLQRIDVDHDLPIATAEGLRHGRSRHTGDLIAHVVLAKIAQLRLIQALSFQSNKTDRKTRCIEFEDYWREGAGGQAPQVGHREIRNCAEVRICIASRLEVNLDQTDSRERA
jgi:hypothetical protein